MRKKLFPLSVALLLALLALVAPGARRSDACDILSCSASFPLPGGGSNTICFYLCPDTRGGCHYDCGSFIVTCDSNGLCVETDNPNGA